MALMRLPARARFAPIRAKMRLRRNPDAFDLEPPDLPSGFTDAKLKESLQSFNRELSTAIRNLEREAIRLRVRPEDLPTQTNRLIGQEVQAARYLFTAASHPELAEYAHFSENEDDLAEKLFGFTLALLRAYEEPEIKELADAWKNQIAERICELRAPVRAHFAQYTGEDPDRDCRRRPRLAPKAAPAPARLSITEELEDMSDEELEALIRAEEGGEEDEDEQPEPQARPQARPVVPAPAVKADKKKPTDTGYADYIVKTRVRIPGQPSEAVLALARGDVLVFRLNDGNAQVWVKGALTLTFTHSRGRSSSKIASLYANEWRKEGGKKREKCRILFAVEGSNDVEVVAASIAEIAAAKPRREVSAERELDDLKRMDLRNNPVPFEGFSEAQSEFMRASSRHLHEEALRRSSKRGRSPVSILADMEERERAHRRKKGLTRKIPVMYTREYLEAKGMPRRNPEDKMKWVRYHDDREEGYVLDPEGEIFSLTRQGFGTVEMFKVARSTYLPAHWQVDLYLDDPAADDRLARKGRGKFVSTFVDAKRLANEMLTTKQNPDWRAMIGHAKKKGAEGAAAAQLAARRAAHDAKVLAMRARIAAERQRVRSSYRVLGLSLLEARDGRYQQEMNALDEIMGGEVGDSLYPSAFGSQRRHREGFFAMEDELAALQKARPNPKRNRRR